MFIATSITNQAKLRRSETQGSLNIALLRSCKRKPTRNYKHFIPTGFNVSTKLAQKTRSSTFATLRTQSTRRE